MISLLPLFLFQGLAWGGPPPAGPTVTYSRSGIDSQYVVDSERLEVRSDGSVVRKTGRAFGDCSPEAGWYEGRISEQDHAGIAEEAGALIRTQIAANAAAKSDVGQRAREIVAHLEVEVNGEISSARLTGPGEGRAAFEDRLGRVAKELRPSSGVRLRSWRAGPGLVVRFELLGKTPFRVILPERTEEGFGPGASYSGRPPGTEVVLTEKRPGVEFPLKVLTLPSRSGVLLRFRNAGFVHHVKGDRISGTAPLGVDLGVRIAGRSEK